MYTSAEAIVLQMHPYKDNSAVVKLYTKQMGLVSCWARSIHSKTSKTRAAILQPLSVINAEVSYKENHNMPQLKEISVAVHTPGIQLSIEKSSIALFLTELLLRILKEASPDVPLYSFIKDSVTLLNSTDKKCTTFHLLFVVRLCDHLGFLPQENAFVQNQYFDLQEGVFIAKEPMHPHFLFPAESEYLTKLSSLQMEDFYQPVIPSAIRKKLLYGLLEYFQLHLGISPLKSHLVLEEVL